MAFDILKEVRSYGKNSIMRLFSMHRPDGTPNVFVFASPRSGSTWLMEMIMSQPGFKYCDEPFNLRTYAVTRQLGLSQWDEIVKESSQPVIQKYIMTFIQGHPCHAKLKHSVPCYRYYRPVTRRIVFKILHAGEDRLDWFKNTFNAKIAYLLRHPIPVTLSRMQFPRLHALIEGEYSRHFSTAQLKFSRRILESGSKMEQGILIWCLQNALPLRHIKSDWAVVSYEQLVMDPVPVVTLLCEKLHLPDPDKMLKALPQPSVTTWQSDDETRSILQQEGQNKNKFLVEKWRRKITEQEEKKLMSILNHFDITVYQAGSFLPDAKFWIR